MYLVSCLTDCDIQLFSPSGVFENPTTSDSNHTCRVLINAPPSVKIRIQAVHIGLEFNSTNSPSTYIMVQTSFFKHCFNMLQTFSVITSTGLFFMLLIQIRDMDVLKTNVFKGQQLFLWHSSGNMAEIEFHGDYLHFKGSFTAEYSFMHLWC